MMRDYRRLLRASRPPSTRSWVAFVLIGLAFWLALKTLEPRPHILQVLESPDHHWVARLEIQRYSRAPSYVVRFKKGRRWRTVFYSSSLISNEWRRATAQLRLVDSGSTVALVTDDVVLWAFDVQTERGVAYETADPAFGVSPEIP